MYEQQNSQKERCLVPFSRCKETNTNTVLIDNSHKAELRDKQTQEHNLIMPRTYSMSSIQSP